MARSTLRVLLLALALGAFYAAFARIALHAFPFSGDEYSYVLQAELFARGMLRAPAPPHVAWLRVDHVVMDDWVRSKYPPGTSALLALGVKAGVPWLVTPVEGVVALLAFGAAARRLLGDRDAPFAVAILGCAPLFALEAATFFSHTASTMWLALALAGVAGWLSRERAGAWRLVLAGAAIGCAFLTRPLDAVLFGVALLALRDVRALAWVAVGVAPFLALHLGYQAAQFGSPWVDGYAAYEPTFRAIYGAQTAVPPIALSNAIDGEQLWHHLDILRSFLVEWTVPGACLLALLGWSAWSGPPGRATVAAARTVLGAIVVLYVATLLVTVGGTDDGPRPRYLTLALLPVALFAAVGWRSAGELLAPVLGRRALWAVAVVVWVLPVIQLGAFVYWRTPEIWVREGLFQAVEKAGVREGVVLVRAEWPTRYARNGPLFDRPILYLSAPRETTPADVAAAYPGRTVYEAREGRTWTIDRVD